MLPDDEERELPVIQRGLVDICFEEAQYESGIDVLTSLCSFRYKPPPLHIRQLVYISLYPSPSASQTSNSNTNANDLPDSVSSPHRIRAPKDDLWPKSSARGKALALLQSYVNINSPSSLMRAFPFYHYVNEDGIHDVDPFSNESPNEKFHEDNTPIRHEILKFQSLNDCWGCLKDGFVKRKQQDQVSRSRKQPIPTDIDIKDEPTLVGPHAWSILEWFISIFEKDQELQRRNNSVAMSPLLLVQIPPPKVKHGPRIALDIPVEIFRECFLPATPNSADSSNSHLHCTYTIPEKRSELGIRLFFLLFNLTLTNPPLLPPSRLSERLAIILRDFELDSLITFFASLRSNHAIFKLNVLEALMTNNEERTNAPVARARAKPRAKKVDRVQSETLPKEPEPIKEAYIVPSLEKVASLLSYLPTHEQDAIKIGLMKYHLVAALFEARNATNMTSYDESIKTGYLEKTIEEGFGKSESIERYKNVALEIVRAWKKQLQ